jgi:tripartite-type tricarboxylate transporter receptor subunit TctC
MTALWRRIAIALTITVAELASASAQTAGWPSKPIRIILPYPAGGGVDSTFRLVGAKVADALGQPIVIENKPGADNIIGTTAVHQSPADGYTFGFIGDSHGVNVALGRNMPYDSEKDFVPVIHVLNVPFVLIANSAQVPFRTLPELIDHAKKNPGWLTFGSLGPGSPHEIAMRWLKAMWGLDMLIVPYRGITPALQDTVAGHVKTMFVGVAVADEMIKAGKVHPIAVTARDRLKSAPDIPTIRELGNPEFEFVTWYGMMAPRGTPPEIVARMNQEFNRALQDPELNKKISGTGGEITGGAPDRVMQLYRQDVEKYRNIFTLTGWRPE